MILQRFRNQMLVIQQNDHSKQVGDFAQRWGNEAQPPPSPRADVLDAAAVHDSGWDQIDDHPILNQQTGWPLEFRGLSPHYQTPMYRLSIERAQALSPYAGLLVSLHLSGLYNDRFGTAPLPKEWDDSERVVAQAFLAEQEHVRAELAPRAIGRDIHPDLTLETDLWRNYRLLQIWDRLSILYAFRLAAGGELAPLPLPDGSDGALCCTPTGELAMALDPYPFDESPCVFPLPARLLPDRPHATIESYLDAINRTPVTILECRASRA
jgi:hypothetical protein